MSPEQVEQLEAHLERVVKSTVNGKIDSVQRTLNDHIVEMKPVLDAYVTANRVGSFIVWASKIIVAIGIVIGTVAAAIRYLK